MRSQADTSSGDTSCGVQALPGCLDCQILLQPIKRTVPINRLNAAQLFHKAATPIAEALAAELIAALLNATLGATSLTLATLSATSSGNQLSQSKICSGSGSLEGNPCAALSLSLDRLLLTGRIKVAFLLEKQTRFETEEGKVGSQRPTFIACGVCMLMVKDCQAPKPCFTTVMIIVLSASQNDFTELLACPVHLV